MESSSNLQHTIYKVSKFSFCANSKTDFDFIVLKFSVTLRIRTFEKQKYFSMVLFVRKSNYRFCKMYANRKSREISDNNKNARINKIFEWLWMIRHVVLHMESRKYFSIVIKKVINNNCS